MPFVISFADVAPVVNVVIFDGFPIEGPPRWPSVESPESP